MAAPQGRPGLASIDQTAGGTAVDSAKTPAAQALRQYQADAVHAVEQHAAAGIKRVLIVAPTGSGKTTIGAELVRRARTRGKRALWLAHRRELVGQACARLYALGIDAGIIQAGWPARPHEHVQVGSVQTLHARAVRTRSIDLPEAQLIIVDEAHHVRSRMYRRLLDAYPHADIIGLTATPCRGDGRGLGTVFDTLIECPSISELTRLGFLCPARIFAPSEPDLKGVRIERGDYIERELSARMDRPQLVGDVVTHWLRLAQRRQTIIFATSIAHSVHLRDEFCRAGVMAAHLDGATPLDEREKILRDFAAGRIEIISNCGVLTEGYDCPAASCCVLARPTKSLGLYFQMVGRVLRHAPGKDDAMILDHAGATLQHGFVDDSIQWTLREDRRAENPAQSARQEGRAKRLAACPECSAIRNDGSPCPVCGWRPRPKPQAVDVIDGELAPVDKTRKVKPVDWTRDERDQFHGELAFIARERGYQPGWAAHKFRERFGAWPPSRNPIPTEPSDVTRAWVRSRQIAFAKARARA